MLSPNCALPFSSIIPADIGIVAESVGIASGVGCRNMRRPGAPIIRGRRPHQALVAFFVALSVFLSLVAIFFSGCMPIDVSAYYGEIKKMVFSMKSSLSSYGHCLRYHFSSGWFHVGTHSLHQRIIYNTAHFTINWFIATYGKFRRTYVVKYVVLISFIKCRYNLLNIKVEITSQQSLIFNDTLPQHRKVASSICAQYKHLRELVRFYIQNYIIQKHNLSVIQILIDRQLGFSLGPNDYEWYINLQYTQEFLKHTYTIFC